MLSDIEIRNYKSINKLSLNLGRVNLFIGENGCGKSNILEAICLASAAEADKLDNNFLSNRGIRVTSSKLMRSNFDVSSCNQPIDIKISLGDSDKTLRYIIENDNEPYSKWSFKKGHSIFRKDLVSIINEIEYLKDEDFKSSILKDKIKALLDNKIEELREIDKKEIDFVNDGDDGFSEFVIYSPENSALRNFYEEGQLEPLGIDGSGLLKLLKVISENDEKAFDDIKDSLSLFGWYKNIEVPKNLNKSNDKIEIKDKFIDSIIDQRSANEGFLFVLFYIALIVSKDTPNVFAIDNIDASLNPRLCTKIMKILVNLSKKYDKQIFLTTHNAAILDGLDVKDEEQCIFVASRSGKGHTTVKKVSSKKEFSTVNGDTLKFSEAFLRGYLGGLPKGF